MRFAAAIPLGLALFAGTSFADDDTTATVNVPHLPMKPHQTTYSVWTGAGFRGNLTVDRDAFIKYYLQATNITLGSNHLLPNFHVFVDDDFVPGDEFVELNIDPATGVAGRLKVSLAAYNRALAIGSSGKGILSRDECECECVCYSLCSTAATIFDTGALGTTM